MAISPTWSAFPSVDGMFTVDRDSCERLAANFGRHTRAQPAAALRPSTVRDVQAALSWAYRHELPVAVRGEAHSTFTQTAVDGGLLIDMRGLSAVGDPDGDSVWVQCGARWSELVERTALGSVYPPVLTDYLGLSVGGTLSVGGIGGESFRWGAQVDNVLELDVVTAQGDLVRCSPTANTELFDLCRGGLGQFGVMTAARVGLSPRPSTVVTTFMRCSTLSAFLAALDAVELSGAVEHLYGNISVADDGSALFEVVATRDAAGSAAPALERMAGIVSIKHEQWAFHDFVHRVERYVASMQSSGAWAMAHPWLDVFVPSDVGEHVMAEALSRLPVSAARPVDMLVYPLRRSVLRAPMLRVPAVERFMLFDVLYNARDLAGSVDTILEANAAAYASCTALGGTLYPIGSTPMSPSQWGGHYADAFDVLTAGKARFDPKHILARGAGALPFGVRSSRV